MRDPLARYFPGCNFWGVVPQLADVAPFRQMFEADKSPDHEYSSNIMWWVVRVYHLTHRNDLREMMEGERKADVSDALFGDSKWHEKPKKRVEELQRLKEGWDKMKPIQLKSLETARRLFQQRDAHLDSLSADYKLNAKEIEVMSSKTVGLIKELENLELAYRMAMGELDEDEDPDGHALESGYFHQ